MTLNVSGSRQSLLDSIDLSDAARLEEPVGFSLVKELDLPPQAESTTIWVFHTTRQEPLYALRAAKPATFQSSPLWGAKKLVLSRRRGGQEQDAEAILREFLVTIKGIKGYIYNWGR